ncbi:MAG TPA: septal ring lytic transglycosylase RlpA family protein [Candidatus Saccharimonadales bacterium]|nr:septal ring lytic transglycosylase RlpA family protein [Candidatus Saccharimonadales bacterium]
MKTKTKKKLKHVHHVVTKKKLVKKRTSQRFLRGFFITVAMISTSGLAFAIATTKPTLSLEVHTKIKAGTTLTIDSGPSTPADQVGQASWYAIGLPQPDALTCASTKYGRGTYLQVKNKRNGRTVICLVNDYGPEAWTHRVIDLSRGSFRVIENLGSGTTPVEVRVVPPPPSGITLPLPKSLSSYLGYSLCRQSHNATFCEANRQKQPSL